MVSAVATGAIVAAGVVVSPMLAVGGVLAFLGAAAVWVRPVYGAYLLAGLTPLIVGIDRDRLLPVLRPNEALFALVAGTLVARSLLTAGPPRRWAVNGVDRWLVAMVAFASVVPLLWLAARGLPLTLEEVLHALTLVKYLGVYLVVRATVRDEAEVARCLWLILGTGVVVAVVAVLQSLQLFGVPGLLATWFAPFGDQTALDNQRGTSLLASSHATADLMVWCLAIALAWLLRGGPRLLLQGMAAVFALGAFGSGQFSGVLGLVVGLVALGLLTRRLTRGAMAAAPFALAALAVMQPVIERRLSGFDNPGGMPSSWVSRLENLERFFWPKLFSGFNWVLGVSPTVRVKAPESWREWVWIESGHTWLLWNGGVPLLIAFFGFLVVGIRATARRSARTGGVLDVPALAACTALWVVAVLTLFDPHLTLRGSGDALFVLLALSFAGRQPIGGFEPGRIGVDVAAPGDEDGGGAAGVALGRRLDSSTTKG